MSRQLQLDALVLLPTSNRVSSGLFHGLKRNVGCTPRHLIPGGSDSYSSEISRNQNWSRRGTRWNRSGPMEWWMLPVVLIPTLALSAKILSSRQGLRTLWSLPIFRELCLLLEVDGSPSWRTHSACLGLRRPWDCHYFSVLPPWELNNQWVGQLWIWHLSPTSRPTPLWFSVTRGRVLLLELTLGKVWQLLWVWCSNCPSWHLVLRTTWGTLLLKSSLLRLSNLLIRFRSSAGFLSSKGRSKSSITCTCSLATLASTCNSAMKVPSQLRFTWTHE